MADSWEMGARYRRARTLLLLLLFFFVLFCTFHKQTGEEQKLQGRLVVAEERRREGGRGLGCVFSHLTLVHRHFFYLILLRKFEFFQPAGVKTSR